MASKSIERNKSNPDTKFVLFHCSFPWADDVTGLLHAYRNVYCDLCWLPILSPSAAEYTLHQLIEIGTSDKICWGCDTWTSEESYGARITANTRNERYPSGMRINACSATKRNGLGLV